MALSWCSVVWVKRNRNRSSSGISSGTPMLVCNMNKATLMKIVFSKTLITILSQSRSLDISYRHKDLAHLSFSITDPRLTVRIYLVSLLENIRTRLYQRFFDQGRASIQQHSDGLVPACRSFLFCKYTNLTNLTPC